MGNFKKIFSWIALLVKEFFFIIYFAIQFDNEEINHFIFLYYFIFRDECTAIF